MHPDLLTTLNVIADLRRTIVPAPAAATTTRRRRGQRPAVGLANKALQLIALGGCLALVGCGGPGDRTLGAQLAQDKGCVACHGMDGVGTSPAFPNLRGQYPSYLYSQLEKYRSGVRNNAIMNGQAANLSDEEMAALAAYYAGE